MVSQSLFSLAYKSSICHLFISPPALNPWQPLIVFCLFVFYLVFACLFFTVIIGLPFPECHLAGIIQHASFPDCLLVLRNIH